MSAAWTNQIFTFYAYGQYNSAPQTVANGSAMQLQTDQNGRLLVNVASYGGVNAPSWYDTGALANSGVIKATSGILTIISAVNESTTTKLWLMLFNATSLPSNTTAPLMQLPIPAATTATGPYAGFDFTSAPRTFSSGIVWAASTTASTLTVATGAGNFWVDAAFT